MKNLLRNALGWAALWVAAVHGVAATLGMPAVLIADPARLRMLEGGTAIFLVYLGYRLLFSSLAGEERDA